LTFDIVLVFLNLYAMLLFIEKSSLQCATENNNKLDNKWWTGRDSSQPQKASLLSYAHNSFKT